MKKNILTMIISLVCLMTSTRDLIAQGGTVTLTLYDARTDMPVAGFNPIAEGSVIDLSKVGPKLNILANVDGKIGSVKFGYNSTENYRVESGAPYALAGDSDGDIRWWTPEVGDNHVTATVYSEAKAQGSVLAKTSINFKVVENGSQTDETAQTEPASDESEIESSAAGGSDVWLEAECAAVLGANWIKSADVAASNGSFISIKSGMNSTGAAPSGSQNIATFNFDVAAGGTYKLYGRTLAASGSDNSFYIRINGGQWSGWNLRTGSSFIWNNYSSSGVALNAGANTIEITYREDGALLDKLYLSQSSTAPSGTGETASNCGSSTGNTVPVVDAGSNKTLTLPTNSTKLTAQASDADGTIASYAWQQVSGPSQATFANANTATVTVSGLVAGTYTFKVTIKDDDGATASDQVQVTVNKETAQEEPVQEEPSMQINNTIVVSESMKIDLRWEVKSHTHIKGTNGAVVKINGTIVRGGLVLYGVKDVIIEGLTIDINSERNFVTGIFLEESSNIIIRNCKFINSRKSSAHPDWTLHGINARNIKGVQVYNNYSDGCQLKLDGGSYSAEDVSITDNYIREATQMGISVVAQPHDSEVVIRNINIERNTFDKIDQHAIYVGVDHGKAEYTYKTTVENITIADNVIGELGYLNTTQVSKGILINGTKDSRNIKILNNKVKNTVFDSEAIGIQLRCTDGGKTTGLDIKGNEISGFGLFTIFIEGARTIDVSENYSKQGKGIIVKNSADGEIYNNYFTDTNSRVRVENSTNIKY